MNKTNPTPNPTERSDGEATPNMEETKMSKVEIVIRTLEEKCFSKGKVTKKNPVACDSTKTKLIENEKGTRIFRCENGHEWFFISLTPEAR